MASWNPGTFAVSKAGHDKGQLYIIIREEGEYIYVADGKTRPLDKKKKKNKKHVQPMNRGDVSVMEKLKNRETVRDEEVKRAIKCCLLQSGRKKCQKQM